MEETIFMEPPNYYITDIIFDIDFHPNQSILSLGTINGLSKCEIKRLSYNTETTNCLYKNKTHLGFLREIRTNPNGQGKKNRANNSRRG